MTGGRRWAVGTVGKSKTTDLTFERHPDGHGGYLVFQGAVTLGAVWYARMCRCWYASKDPFAKRPDYSLKKYGFQSKEEAGRALT